MKPKVFLGSSVEGLSVAYAVQTNLYHDAEITVWSQGVFELSGNTLDSLLVILESVDFAIFVFSPDDIIKIREKNVTTVRDNVLFEFGMFLGKLGKNRVFYITPDKSDLKLPTDLLGVTPGKYETNRDDSNLIAATGQASHQIRLLIQKHGLLNPIKENSTIPEILDSSEPSSDHWFDDYVAKRYDEAIIKLDSEIEKANDLQVVINFKLMKIQCFCRLDEKNIKLYDELLNENMESEYAYSRVATSLSWENYIDKAIDIINRGVLKFGMTTNLMSVLASCHLKNGDRELAIQVFSNDIVYNDPKTANKFADIYIDEKDYNTAQKIIHKVYLKYPNNKEIWSKYASIASELSLNKIALYFYDKLSNADPKEYSHHGYIGNICLQLNLNDISLSKYQEANELSGESQAWLTSNIGNLLNNKGFYSEAIKYLKRSIKQNESSEYAHDRLSSALKLKEEESKQYQKMLNEAKQELKGYSEKFLEQLNDKS